MSEELMKKLHRIITIQNEKLEEINSKLDLVLEGMSDSDFGQAPPEGSDVGQRDLFDELIEAGQDYEEGRAHGKAVKSDYPDMLSMIMQMLGAPSSNSRGPVAGAGMNLSREIDAHHDMPPELLRKLMFGI